MARSSHTRFLPLFLFLSVISPTTTTAMITVAARGFLLEATPLVVAMQDYYTASNGTFISDLPDLWQNRNVDLDAGAEVHVLHDAPGHADLRIVTTVAEVYYRIVANNASGTIHGPADLKGKRIGVVANTTSEYFAYRYLRDVAGLKDDEYTLVGASGGQGLCYSLPCGNGTLPKMLALGQIDALTAYEPTTELAAMTIGEKNAVMFRNDSLYRELSVMYTTQAKLDDPVTRKEIVRFLKALGKVQETFATEPTKVWDRVASITNRGMSVQLLERIWGLTRWSGGLPADMVDLLAEEDEYIARDKTLKRTAMTRERIASHIDSGPLAEVANKLDEGVNLRGLR
ncbi:hypothetical protein B0H66DRAFT_581915 [Apodospora peruviana]|uniref:SsuA/THI5-like domain-containing protein n=1 Tax=Apodospora peruviana TaxID=516989 RepID=A0AAE0I3K3_9PEZI|nr:hypothetical protein B0H66DRAFT_581915 [Apodospora peruviana]